MRAVSKMVLAVSVLLGTLFVSSNSFAWSQEGPHFCEIKQTSAGDFGVRELRASGWVYIVRQLSLEKAVETLEYLRSINRCY